MNYTTRFNQLKNDIVANIAIITARPDGWLPHTVFIIEDWKDGIPIYKSYQLVDFKSDDSCTLRDTSTNEDDNERQLSEINIDSLMTVFRDYCDLSEEQEEVSSEQYSNPLEYSLRLLLDVALLEIPCFEQSETYSQCVKALTSSDGKSKELKAFLFPIEMGQDATNEEILRLWNSGDKSIITYTPHELAAILNIDDAGFHEHYVRFI